ncbi:MAG: glycosyltransferase family 2 protein [Solirubrobacterales bacterium]
MSRLVLITPARNEASHIERTAAAVAAQTRRPDRWLIVDDGSSDETPALLRRLEAELPFLEVLSAPQSGLGPAGDRLALAAEARAFNWAAQRAGKDDFTHLGKLDADIELPPEYFAQLLARFSEQPRLGIAGGDLLEPGPSGWQLARVPAYHVRGAMKLYSRRCFEEIGGIEERLGWDTIDETYARMEGYETRTFGDLLARHHRPVATADGALRGRARHGECAYIVRYGAGWVLLRAFKVAGSRPRGLSGLAFLYGYLRAALSRAPRVEDEAFRRFVASELRARVRAAPSRLLRGRNGAPRSAQVRPFFVRSYVREPEEPPRIGSR